MKAETVGRNFLTATGDRQPEIAHYGEAVLSGVDTLLFLYTLLSGAESGEVDAWREYNQPNFEALHAAWEAIDRLDVERDCITTLAVVDFTLPSHVPRMEIYQKDACTPNRYLCAHGKNTGGIMAREFSNEEGSYQSSLGLYRVGESYDGAYGQSLRLHGLELGVNDRARERAIVLHSAWYVSEDVILQNILEGLGPRLGRSLGCPAVPQSQLAEVCEALQPGSLIYIYGHPDS